MCRAVYNFELPPDKNGKVRKLGDLIDRTPKHLISKVALEEKVFDTWYSGRTVLLGDGKHFIGILLPSFRPLYWLIIDPYCLLLCLGSRPLTACHKVSPR